MVQAKNGQPKEGGLLTLSGWTGRPGYLPALARGKGVRCVFIFALQLPVGVITPEICKPIITGKREKIYLFNMRVSVLIVHDMYYPHAHQPRQDDCKMSFRQNWGRHESGQNKRRRIQDAKASLIDGGTVMLSPVSFPESIH